MLLAEAQTELIEALLKQKADINYINRYGRMPPTYNINPPPALNLLAFSPPLSIPYFPPLHPPEGMSPLMLHPLNPLTPPSLTISLSLTHLLPYPLQGMSPLMLACRLKDPKLIHVLMRAEANVLKHAGR